MRLLISGAGGGDFPGPAINDIHAIRKPGANVRTSRTGAGGQKGTPAGLPFGPRGADGPAGGAACRQNPFRGVSCEW
jgi:hypothetical protein